MRARFFGINGLCSRVYSVHGRDGRRNMVMAMATVRGNRGEEGQQKGWRAFWSGVTDYWALNGNSHLSKTVWTRHVARETAAHFLVLGETLRTFTRCVKRTCRRLNWWQWFRGVRGGGGVGRWWAGGREGFTQRVGGKTAKMDKRGINFKTVQFNAIHYRDTRIFALASRQPRRGAYYFSLLFLHALYRSKYYIVCYLCGRKLSSRTADRTGSHFNFTVTPSSTLARFLPFW